MSHADKEILIQVNNNILRRDHNPQGNDLVILAQQSFFDCGIAEGAPIEFSDWCTETE